MRIFSVVAIWSTSMAAALVVAWQVEVGRVVFVLSERHGVHLGDLAAFAVAAVGATLLSLVVLAAPRR